MRTLPVLAALGLFSLGLSTTATAGTLTIEKKGLVPAFMWVDGQSIGKVKKKGMEHTLSDGPHEIWVAGEASGVITRCHGLIDGSATSFSITDRGCSDLAPGYGASTFFKGAAINFSVDGQLQAWVSIDGGQKFAFPSGPFKLNLQPGQHSIVLYTDVMSDAVFDQGTVSLAPNSFVAVTCTTGGCTGFDQPPVVIQMVEAPASSVSVDVQSPGLSIDINVNGGGAPMTGSSSSPSSRSGGSVNSGGSSNQSCCINNAYYDCPNADAVYTCSGAFMACMMDCGMMDMDCPQKCDQTHPLDPSKCSRNSSKDNTCSN